MKRSIHFLLSVLGMFATGAPGGGYQGHCQPEVSARQVSRPKTSKAYSWRRRLLSVTAATWSRY